MGRADMKSLGEKRLALVGSPTIRSVELPIGTTASLADGLFLLLLGSGRGGCGLRIAFDGLARVVTGFFSGDNTLERVGELITHGKASGPHLHHPVGSRLPRSRLIPEPGSHRVVFSKSDLPIRLIAAL